MSLSPFCSRTMWIISQNFCPTKYQNFRKPAAILSIFQFASNFGSNFIVHRQRIPEICLLRTYYHFPCIRYRIYRISMIFGIMFLAVFLLESSCSQFAVNARCHPCPHCWGWYQPVYRLSND